MQEHIIKMLSIIIPVFNKHNINYWIDFGTLLGAIREKTVIPWDEDGDISIVQSESAKVCSILPEIIHREPDILQNVECWFDGAFKFKPTPYREPPFIDVYPWIKKGHIYEHPQKCFGIPRFPAIEVESFTYIDFLGFKTRVPTRYHERLTRLYGDYNVRIKCVGGYWSDNPRIIVDENGKQIC